ncbi:MAG: DUF2059 domain-containing protein [Stenotrophomonas sp.]
MLTMRANRLRFPTLLLVALAITSTAPVLAATPTDGDINRLLAASRAQTMLDTMLPQMEAMQQQQIARFAAQQSLNGQQQAQLQRIQQSISQTLRQALSWPQMRAMYVDAYRQSFSKEDVLAMAEFYESPAGQSLLDKTPALMQNLMLAIQTKMQPLMSDMQKDLEQILNEQPAAK